MVGLKDRRSLRYPSDISDVEWAMVTPLIPRTRRGRRRLAIDEREILGAICYGDGARRCLKESALRHVCFSASGERISRLTQCCAELRHSGKARP
jgi:hypothetical protein